MLSLANRSIRATITNVTAISINILHGSLYTVRHCIEFEHAILIRLLKSDVREINADNVPVKPFDPNTK